MSLLSDRSLLVRPSISVWRGEVIDRAASRETADRAEAQRGQVKTTKFLVSKEAIDPILTSANALRSFVKQETLPWRWDGVGLLPTENYFNFTDGWRQRRMIFEAAVAHLTSRWSLHVATGRRALGRLASEYDYPSKQEVESRFAVSLERFPVPTAQDFRASVTEAEAETIRERLTASNEAEVERIQVYMWQQMHDAVERIVTRLGEYEKDDTGKVTKGRLHESLIGNLTGLTDRLARLNVTKNQEIDAMRLELQHQLCGHGVEELKNDDTLRVSVKDAATELLSQLKGVLG